MRHGRLALPAFGLGFAVVFVAMNAVLMQRRFGDLDHGLLMRLPLYIALTWMHVSGLRTAALTVVMGLVAGSGLAVIAALWDSSVGEDGG